MGTMMMIMMIMMTIMIMMIMMMMTMMTTALKIILTEKMKKAMKSTMTEKAQSISPRENARTRKENAASPTKMKEEDRMIGLRRQESSSGHYYTIDITNDSWTPNNRKMENKYII